MNLSTTRRVFCGLAAAAVMALAPASASAGTFNVVSCSASNTWVNNSWTTSFSTGGQFDAYTNCNSSSASAINGVDVTRALAIATKPVSMPAPASAFWRLDAPSGLTITRLAYNRQMRIYNSGVWRVQTLADTSELEGCQLGPLDTECNVNAGSRGTIAFTSLTATSVRFGASCISGCIGGGSGPAVAVAAGSMSVTLSDPTNPSANALSGSLPGGSSVTGSQSVTVSGSDLTGIKTASVLIDGNQVNSTNNSSCDFSFTRPCAQISPSFSSTFSVDTSALAPGSHTLTGRVYDAAGNMASSSSSFSVYTPPLVTPPVVTPPVVTPPPPAPTPRNSYLRLTSSSINGKTLKAQGLIHSQASGTITVKVSYRDSKGKAKTKTYTATKSGQKWTLNKIFTPKKASMSIKFTGNSPWVSVSLVKSLSVKKK